MIRELDAELDEQAWFPGGDVVRSSLALVSRGSQVMLAVKPGGVGWPWLESEVGAAV